MSSSSSFISKDVASIIAKYNKPTIFRLQLERDGEIIPKYDKIFDSSSKDGVIKYIFVNRNNLVWAKELFNTATDIFFDNLTGCSCCYGPMNFDVYSDWPIILEQYIQPLECISVPNDIDIDID